MPFSIDFCHRRSRDTGVQYRLSLKKKKKRKILASPSEKRGTKKDGFDTFSCRKEKTQGSLHPLFSNSSTE